MLDAGRLAGWQVLELLSLDECECRQVSSRPGVALPHAYLQVPPGVYREACWALCVQCAQ